MIVVLVRVVAVFSLIVGLVEDDSDGGGDDSNGNNSICIALFFRTKLRAQGVVQYHNTNCSNSHQNQYNDK